MMARSVVEPRLPHPSEPSRGCKVTSTQKRSTLSPPTVSSACWLSGRSPSSSSSPVAAAAAAAAADAASRSYAM